MTDQACVKCGGLDHWTRWLPEYAYRPSWECKQRNVTEHLCRGCRRCGYTWDEKTMEQQAA